MDTNTNTKYRRFSNLVEGEGEGCTAGELANACLQINLVPCRTSAPPTKAKTRRRWTRNKYCPWTRNKSPELRLCPAEGTICMRYERGVPRNNNGTRPSICIHLNSAGQRKTWKNEENMRKERKSGGKICGGIPSENLWGLFWVVCRGNCEWMGGSNEQKNITFDLSMGGARGVAGPNWFKLTFMWLINTAANAGKRSLS